MPKPSKPRPAPVDRAAASPSAGWPAPEDRDARRILAGVLPHDEATLTLDQRGALMRLAAQEFAASLGVPVHTLGFFGQKAGAYLAMDELMPRWLVYRAGTPDAIREEVYDRCARVSVVEGFAWGVVHDMWRAFGAAPRFDPSLIDEGAFPALLPENERPALIAAAERLFLRSLELSRATMTEYDTPVNDEGDEVPATSWDEWVRVHGAPSMATGAHWYLDVPHFVVERTALAQLLADHTYSAAELSAFVALILPKWDAPATAREAYIADGLGRAAFEHWRDQLLSDAKARASEAEARAAALEERATRQRRTRQGSGWLMSVTRREDHVQKARRENADKLLLSAADVEARKLFKPELLSPTEQAVLVALANIAHERRLTDSHPVALQLTPEKEAVDPPRLAIPFEGFAELARRCGVEPGPDGRIPKEDVRTVKRALETLTTHAFNIPVPVRVPVYDKKGRVVDVVDDIEVQRTLWVEPTTRVLSGGTSLRLHPQAVGGMQRSWVDHPHGLLARYKAAKDAVGAREVRREWVACDNYLLNQAKTLAKGARLRAAAEDEPTVRATVTQDIRRELFWEQLGITKAAKKQGRPWALEREADALRACQAMGSLVSWSVREGKDGAEVLVLELPDPGAPTDPTQTSLFRPDSPD